MAGKNHTAAEYLANKAERRKSAQEAANYNQSKIDNKIAGLQTALGSNALYALGQDGYKTSDQTTASYRAAIQAYNAYKEAASTGADLSAYERYIAGLIKTAHDQRSFYGQFADQQDYNERYAYPKTVEGKTGAEIEAMMAGTGDAAYLAWLNNNTLPGIDKQIAGNQTLLDTNKAKQDEINNRAYTGQSTPEINAARVARDYWANMTPPGQMIRADRADQVKYNTQQRLYDVYTKAMTGAPMTDEEQKIFDAYVSNNPAWQEHQERMDANLSAQKETQRQIEDKQYKRDVYSGQRETSYADFIEILRDNNSPLMINLNRAGKELDKANAALESFDTEHDAYMATMPVISETGDMSRVWADIDYADDNKGRYNQLVADRDSKQAAFDAAAAAIEDAYNGYIGAAINGVDAGDMYLVEATERLGELQNKQADISEQQYAAAMPSTPEPLGKSRAEAFEEERKKQQGLAELRLDSVLSTAAGDWQAKNSQELYNLTSEQNDIEFQNAILKAKREEVVVRSKYNDLAAAPDFKALSVYDSSNGDSLYQFINNKGTSQEQGAAPAFFTGEVAGAIDVGAANAEASYQAAGYTFLLPEEVQAYNYIYKKDGRDKAQEFLDSFQNIRYLRARSKESEEWAKYADEHGVWASVVSLGTNLASGLMYPVQALDAALNPNHSQFSNLYTANYATQAIRGTVGQNVAEWAGNDLGNTVYQTLMSMGDMLVAMGAGKVAGLATGSGFAKGLTQYIMSSEAGSSTLLNSLQRNIAPNKAVGMSIASAMIEALTEKYSIDALLKEPKKAALYIAKNMLTEGSEEAASNIANTLVDLIVNADQAELAQAIAEKGYAQALTEYAQSVGLDAIMGAISGGVMSGGKVTVGNTIKTANETANAISTGKQINKNQTYKQLHDLAVAMPEGSKARQLAWKSGEKVTALKAGKVYHALMQDLDERGAAAVRNSMVADIKGRMRELGATGDLTAVAEAVQKLWMGEKLSAREQDMIATSPVAMRVQRELLDNTDEWATKAKSSANSAYETAAYNKQRTVSQLASQGYKVAEDKAATKGLAENATTTYDNAEQEKTLNTAAYTPQNVALTVTKVVEADGKLMFEAEQDGQTATYAPSELDFDSYNTAYMGRVMVSNHMSAEAANTMLQFYGKGGVTGPAYVQGFAVAYNAGRIGTGMAYANNSLYGRALSGDARKAAYDAGLKDAKNAPKKAPVARRKGNVTIDKDIDYKSLTKGQKAAINAMREIAPRLGIDVEFFASQADESGSYKDWENGSYKDGVIRLDINAGRDDVKSRAQFAILRTASHELTHFIKDASPDLYAELQEFVVTHLIEGGKSMEQLIADKKAREKREMTDPEAIEEIVADACEMMLKDSKAIQTLAEENATLFEKMAKWLRDFFSRVRKAFEGVSYAHAEAGALMKKDADGILHYIDGLQEMWDRALVDAGRRSDAIADVGAVYDAATESAAPSYSLRTWNESEYVQEAEKAAEELAKALKVSKAKAERWINDINGIAKMVADNRELLDYEANEFTTAIKSNAEYGGSVDFSTICAKRRLATGTLDAIQRALRNSVLTQDDIFRIRNMMLAKKYEVACGLCYVESARKDFGRYAKAFLDEYKQTNPEWIPDMADVNTVDGLDDMRREHPEAYAAYEKYMNKLAQRKPKLYEKRTEYRNEILKKFKGDDTVSKKNLAGGFRIQSFSDFEIVHLLDMMQVIMDMSHVGLAGQAYTKVPDFAWAMGDTGLKINLSMIAKGVKDGKIVYDEREGMKVADAKALRDRYSKNVGTILVVFSDAQLKAALNDDFIDFIIPFHRSQWNKKNYGALGLPTDTRDFTSQQNERYIKPHYNERGKRIRPVNYSPNAYWDYNKTGKENAETYLRMCAADGRRPKFAKLLVDNGDGSYSLQPDGSTDGYWKLLIDFKMYDNAGNGSPQLPVQPNFNMEQARRMLEDYKGGHASFPVAQDIVDEFVKEYKAEKFSTREADAAYLSAVNRGDMKTAQRLVDEAARNAGYKPLKLYHGTRSFGFKKFDINKLDDKMSIFVTDNERIAESYSGENPNRSLKDSYGEDRYEFLQKTAKELEPHAQKYMGENIRVPSKEWLRQYTDGESATILSAMDWVEDYLQQNENGLSLDTKQALANILYYGRKLAAMPWNSDIKNEGDAYKLRFKYEDAMFDLSFASSNVYDDIEQVANRTVVDTANNLISTLGDPFYDENTGSLVSRFDVADVLGSKMFAGIYDLYGDQTNLFEIDANDANWNTIDGAAIGRPGVFVNTRDVAEYAKKKGYNGVLIKNVRDGGGMTAYHGASNVYIFFDPNSLKSADPVTYDDAGNVIPLSERFNEGNEDIRYARRDAKFSHFMAVSSRHVMNLQFADPRLAKALDYDPKERVDDFEEIITRLQTRVMNGEDDIIMETAMSKRGDRLKLVILEKRGDMEYDIVDVYELHTEKYDGRVAGVVNILEEGVKKYNEQEFHRWLGFVGESYVQGSLFKYNRHTSRYVKVRSETSGKRRVAAGTPGTQRNGSGTAGGIGQVSYQHRDADTISEREILANADPDAFKHGGTAGYLRDYQKAYRELENLMTKLADYREKAASDGLSADEKAKADNRVALAEKQVHRQEEKLAKLEAKPVFEKVLESERKSLNAYVSGRTPAQLTKEIERYESKMTALSGYEKEAREQARKARRLARSLYKERNRWIREGDALKLAQNLVKQNSSTLKAGDLAPRIRGVFEDLANGKNMAAAVAELNRIAGEVVSSAKSYEESSVAYVGQYLKDKTIKLTDAQKQEAKSAYGSVADFKRRTKLNISENGVDLTKLWNELADLNPVLFDVQETEGGMVYALAAAMEAAQPEAYNPFAGDEAAAAEQIATDLLDEGVGMEIRLPAIEKQRKHYQEVIAKLRSANAEKLALANQRGRERLERYREKTKDTASRSALRDRIKHDVKALNRLLLNETDVKHIPEELKGAMAQFLKVFTDDSSVFSKGMLDDLRYAYDKISDRAKGDEDISQLASAYDEGMAEVISDLRSLLDGRRLSELDIDETRTVRDIVSHLITLVKHQNNLFFEERRASVETNGKELIAEAEEHGPAKGNKLTREVRTLLREGMMTPAYFFKQLGGVGKKLYDALKEGESTYGLNVKKSAGYFAEKAKQYNYDKWRLDKPMTMTTQQGHEITLTREQALGLYATWKRENSDNGQSAKHLSEGGFVYEDAMQKDKDGKITVNTHKPNKMSEADMQKVAAWLTAEQKAFADDLVRYMSVDMAALGNKVSMAMYGVKKFTEETYYPYQTSQDYRYTPLGQGAATNDQRLKHSSFTRRTQQHANNPIIASDFTTVWANHVNHMILYSAMCLPLENVNRIYNYRYTDENGEKHSVKAALKDAYGEQAAKYIEQLMNDLNGGVQIRGTGWVNTLVSKFKRNAVFASLSVAIQQPSSVVRAMAIVDPKYFGNGIAMDGGWDELTKYSGVAVIKEMGGFDTSTGYGAQAWILGNRADTKLEKVSHAVDKVGGFLPEKMDRLAWTAIWRAIKAETRANTDLVVGSEEFLQAAAKRFDEVISYTQVYDSVLAKSQMMRNPALNAITTFMSEPTLTYNMLLDAFTHRGKADSVSIPRAMTAFVATAAVNAMLKALVTAARDDDEEKSYIEKYLGKSLESFINDLNPLNMIPLARDMVSILQGYDVERPDMSLISDLVNGFNRGKKAFVDGDIYNGIKEIAGPVGAFFNLPVKNVWRDAEAIVGLATRPFMPTTEDGIRYSLLEALPGYGSKASDYYSRRLDAMLAGDDRELESLTIHLESGMGKSAKAIKTQTKTELGKRYKAGKVSDVIATDILMDYFAMDADEAYWQLKEWREKEAHGDDEEYTFSRTADLENALLSGKTSQIEAAKQELTSDGGYTAKEVVTKTKAAIKNLYVDGKITFDQAAKMLTEQLEDYQNTEKPSKKRERQKEIENDLYWIEKEWAYAKANKDNDAAEPWSDYMTLHTAIEGGKGQKAAIKELLDHGKTKSGIASSIKARWQDEYVKLYNTNRKAALQLQSQILDAYVAAGYSRTEQAAKIKKEWFK